MHRWEGIAIAAIIGISLVAGTLIVAQTIDFVKTFDNSQLTVTGSTQEVITSDEVKWTSQFSRETSATDLKSGYLAMQKDRTAVVAFLSGQGVSGSAVTISPIALNPVYNNCGIAQKLGAAPGQPGCVNQIVSYRLVENVEVDSSNVQKVTSLAQDSSTLINQGVVFSTTGLKYYDTKLSGLREKLLAAATKDAQLRAQGIAASTGMKIGHLLSVNTGVIQITPVNSTQVLSVGVYDTSTIQKKVTAVVRASFTLEQ